MKEIILAIVKQDWSKKINPSIHQVRCKLGITDSDSEKEFMSTLYKLVSSKKILLEPVQKQYFLIIPYPTNSL